MYIVHVGTNTCFSVLLSSCIQYPPQQWPDCKAILSVQTCTVVMATNTNWWAQWNAQVVHHLTSWPEWASNELQHHCN